MTEKFNLSYASHLGYLPPDFRPLFEASVDHSTDPGAHVEFAATQGLAGVFHPWVASHPRDHRERFAQAVADHGMQCGGIVFAPFDVLTTPLWVRDTDEARETVDAHLAHSAHVAATLGSKALVTVLCRDETLDPAVQWRTLVDRLRRAGDQVAARDQMLVVEPMMLLPAMFLDTFEQGVRLLDEVNHPAVRLIFDTGHVDMMSGDIQRTWRESQHRVGVVQLTDMPGRIELGAGRLDMVRFLEQVIRDGHADSLIELECAWADPTLAGEQAGMAALRAIDSQLGPLLQERRSDTSAAN
ncbi:sugar phosphate isomerase/epimerase family protein [Novosphingobium mathurense]|uniref:Hydroxypyruvate isomerase n=1 Tax=Novosphingobium mathurense TaxID=428990 RepID=A0A1U6IIR7_9SPHN|nr:sugar phosphate isomerase/epimerase family protein [Novosphingobium mathurense]SLK07903.1 hydroxypyruvate isomerase [Novosphingobium mathurense]